MLKGLTRALGTLLALLTLYSLLGFLVLPGVALRIANQQLAQYATVPAHLQRIEFNPFTLELTLWGLEVGEPGKAQVGFERLYANLQLDSLWRRALHLESVTLDAPRTELLFNKRGQLNLTRLFALPPSEPPAEQAAGEPFPLRVDHLAINEGYLHFRDLRPSEPIEFLYDSMNVQLKNLSTLADDNADMSLVAKSPAGGRIDWQGSLSLSPIASKGILKVTDAKMKLWWPYVRDALPLVLQDGVLSLETQYTLNLAKNTELRLDQASVRVAPLAINAPDGRPLAHLASLKISEASVDLARQKVVVGKVRSEKLETWAALERDGQLDWQVLFAGEPGTPARPDAKAKAAPATAAPVSKTPTAPAKPWQVVLKDVQTRGALIHLADRRQKEPVALDVGPLNLSMTGYDSLNRSPFALKLDTGIGKQGKLQATGQVNLAPVSAQLDVSTQDIDLRIAQAYISPYILLELRSGMLSSALNVNVSSIEPVALTVIGNAQVDQLHTLDTIKNRDLIKWERINADGIRYVHGDAVSIDTIRLQQPYARFIINEDRSTNIDDLLIPQPAGAQAASEPPAARRAEKPLGIRIGRIDIADGSANFADMTLTPNFATAAQQLNGVVGTLDNRQSLRANVDIQGKVDRYAPVIIHGALNPFNPMDSLDIAASFRRVELTTLTPYSGKFAGYRIRKGRLNLDLHYVITQGQLKAENRVEVEQLQLGDRVDSPDAVDLPIRLAVALLKDTHGKISIELPVSGDLNNPQFSVMPIVWQTLRNLALRAVQAPFKILGGLVAGGQSQDLSTVAFAPGSSELGPDTRAALDKLASGLKARPQLRLEIEGTSAQSSDGPLLAQQRLDREYQATWYKILQRRGDKVPANASQLVVSDDDKPAMLEGIYRLRLKQQPPAQWEQLSRDERTRLLRDAVLKYWSESATLQRQLGQDRASSIKDYLVDKGGLEDDRVYFIDTALGQAEKDGKVVTPLHLDAG